MLLHEEFIETMKETEEDCLLGDVGLVVRSPSSGYY